MGYWTRYPDLEVGQDLWNSITHSDVLKEFAAQKFEGEELEDLYARISSYEEPIHPDIVRLTALHYIVWAHKNGDPSVTYAQYREAHGQLEHEMEVRWDAANRDGHSFWDDPALLRFYLLQQKWGTVIEEPPLADTPFRPLLADVEPAPEPVWVES